MKGPRRRLKWVPDLLFCLAIISAPAAVSAHVLVTDGQIGVLMHMDPEDDPVAGLPTTFYLDFKDTSQRLAPASCDGSFSILQSGKIVYTQTLFPPGTKTLDIAQVYTFPAEGSYTVQVSGAPMGSAAFQPFDLKFYVNVSRTASGLRQNGSPGGVAVDNAGGDDGSGNGGGVDHNTHYLVVSLVAITTTAIVTAGFLLGFKRKRKRK